jgi:hypothetical protein
MLRRVVCPVTWKSGSCPRGRTGCPVDKWASFPSTPWMPSSLHGDTNTDEMFIFTTILYLVQHGDDVHGGETGIADAVIDSSEFGEVVTSGLRVQPSVGRLLVFSAGVENMHEMLPVRHGTRVAVQMWFACDGMQPGWAYPQRVAFGAAHGYGAPDSPRPAGPSAGAPPKSPLPSPWPWRG